MVTRKKAVPTKVLPKKVAAKKAAQKTPATVGRGKTACFQGAGELNPIKQTGKPKQK